jgi:undecaprenyl-diphosphatase
MNQSIFYFFYNLSHHSVLFDTLSIFCADYLPYGVLLVLLYLFFKKHRVWGDKKIVLLAVGSGFVARYIVKGLIVMFFPYQRPYIVLPDVVPLIAKVPSEFYQSFPSGHTIFFFAIATIVYLYHKRLGILFFGISLLMGLARIIVGAHWPSDILVGIILGIAVGYSMYLIYTKSKTVEKIIHKL